MNCMPKAVSLSPYTKKSLEKNLKNTVLDVKLTKRKKEGNIVDVNTFNSQSLSF